MKRSAIYIGFAIVMLCAADNARACVCVERRSIAEALELSSMVFVGRLESVEQTENSVPISRVTVERSFKGKIPASKTIDLAAGALSDCSYLFGNDQIGSQWLFYLERPEQKYFYNSITNKSELSSDRYYWASTCGRTRAVEGALDDLAYLNHPEKYNGKTRLSGSVFDHDPSRSVGLRLTGNRLSIRPTLDPSGYFEFFDFPPGQYTLEIEPPICFAASRLIGGGYLELEKTVDSGRVVHKIDLNIAPGQHLGFDFQLYRTAYE